MEVLLLVQQLMGSIGPVQYTLKTLSVLWPYPLFMVVQSILQIVRQTLTQVENLMVDLSVVSPANHNNRNYAIIDLWKR